MFVLVGMHGRHEVSARSRAQNVFQEAKVEIAVERIDVVGAVRSHDRAYGVMTEKALELLRVAREAAVCLTLSRRGTEELIGGGIREAEHGAVKVFVDNFGVHLEKKIAALFLVGRNDAQMALAFEDRPCYLAVNLAVEGKAAAAEREGGRIALELEILDRDNFAAWQ